MQEEYRAEPAEEVLPQTICYRLDASRRPWLYDNAPIVSVTMLSLAMALLCAFLIADANPVSTVFGIVAAIAFLLYVGRYVYHFRKSRQLVTRETRLEDGRLTVVCDAWTRSFALDELVFTMSYSSSTNLCIIAATENEYLTMTCSCGFLLSRDGLQALRPFYALNKALMAWNPNHVNYVKNKRYRRKNPFKIPLYVFEVEYDTPRVTKLINQLRQAYRFDRTGQQEGEEQA